MGFETLGTFGAPELFLMAAVLLLLWAVTWSSRGTRSSSSTPDAGARVPDRAYLDRLFGEASTTAGPIEDPKRGYSE